MHPATHRFFPIAALASLLQMNAALGSVYPTQPIFKTKFFSGKSALVKWRDNSQIPYLEDMPHIKIELYNNSTYITTLADHVAPTDRSHTVSIPPGLEGGAHYSLLFKTRHPPLSSWSADFTIVSQAQDYLFPARPAVVNNSTSTSSTSSPAATPTAVHPNPMGAHPGSPYRDGGDAPKKGGATKLDLETVPLRVLIVLLPVLVGISLAL
ncbi:hypothetical protein DXG01_015491 [Tephrocybe rancida]|nr:hypothetical protein DXG01_015491 [Tephrocybe rancida]